MADTSLDLDALQRAVDGLRTQQESVQRERAELQSMKATVEENLAQFKRRVKLNVGGSKFETTLTTLTRYPDSMLGSMFSGRHEVPPDEEDYIFIDRDGTHFRTILNFLRTGVLDVTSSTKDATELKREMEYYQLGIDQTYVTIEPDLTRKEIQAELRSNKLNFTGCRLTGIDLSYLDLTDAILNDTNLRGANLQGAQLGGAQLKGANLENANFKDAILYHHKDSYHGVKFATLQEANLHGAKNLCADQVRVRDGRGGVNLMNAITIGTELHGIPLKDGKLWQGGKLW